jgi:hypothetical protein
MFREKINQTIKRACRREEQKKSFIYFYLIVFILYVLFSSSYVSVQSFLHVCPALTFFFIF